MTLQKWTETATTKRPPDALESWSLGRPTLLLEWRSDGNLPDRRVPDRPWDSVVG
jgi:hypothetical protein